jgi:hypothetical protein
MACNKNTEDGDFIMFQIGDPTVYSRVLKQLLDEAKAITPYGKDIARMLIQEADVDFAPDCPTKRIVVDSDAAKMKVLQEQADTLFQIQIKKWVDRCDAYGQNKSVMCGLIARRCHTELSDRLETRPGHQDWTLDGPLIYLRMILEAFYDL